MPTLSTPTLTLGTTTQDKRDVTVAGSITFDAGDVGKTFRLEIKLFGEDQGSDQLATGDALGDDLLYVYTFPSLLLPRPFKNVTVTAAGTVNYAEKRAVATALLDEDAGKVQIGEADIHSPVFMPRSDEVYASVTLSTTSLTRRSATVAAGIGV